MTIARAQLVDPSVTRWYHCVTRCVRRAHLLAEGALDRKQWIENRLKELAEIFAVSVAGFAVLDNHLHVLVRLDPDVVGQWSDEDVVKRWGRLFPPRDQERQALPLSKEWIRGRLQDADWVARARQRLASLSWFMKCLKEPLARMANREDGAKGAFFEARFKSVAILDEESLLSVCTYIDLNLVAAGLAAAPEASPHTSILERVSHAEEQGRLEDIKAVAQSAAAGVAHSSGLEESLWLCPIEDRRAIDSAREGMLAGFTLGHYLLLVDYTGRLFRRGKASISRAVAAIFDRIGSDAETWQVRQLKLSEGRLLGRFFAASRQRLRDVAGQLSVRHLDNLASCPAR